MTKDQANGFLNLLAVWVEGRSVIPQMRRTHHPELADHEARCEDLRRALVNYLAESEP